MKNIHRTPRLSTKSILAITVVLSVVFAGMTLFENLNGTPGTVLASMASAEAPSAEPQAAKEDSSQEGPATASADGKVFEDKSSSLFNDSLESLALSLKQREKDLEKREEALKEEEKRLEALRMEVEQNLARMEQTLKQMESLATQANAIKEEALTQWIGIYQTMAPADVAKIIEGVDEIFAIRLLSAMVPKKAGEVLSAIPPETSIKLSKHLTEQN